MAKASNNAQIFFFHEILPYIFSSSIWIYSINFRISEFDFRFLIFPFFGTTKAPKPFRRESCSFQAFPPFAEAFVSVFSERKTPYRPSGIQIGEKLTSAGIFYAVPVSHGRSEVKYINLFPFVSFFYSANGKLTPLPVLQRFLPTAESLLPFVFRPQKLLFRLCRYFLYQCDIPSRGNA